ncbi:MAG: recombination mediator RecR [Patescibacteria group bacterium]|jgi:recombination protein RecR
MDTYPDSINKLIEKFFSLPGIGPKAAERIVFYLLKQPPAVINDLMSNLANLKKEIVICQQCFNVSAKNPCEFCQDAKRDKTIICVISEPQDLQIIEKTGEYRGLYHILGGNLNPVEGITPEKLHIEQLINRIQQKSAVKEIIIATNPDLEGESTAMYLTRKLKDFPVKITRLAKGLSMGSTIEYADEVTMSNALKGRQEIK